VVRLELAVCVGDVGGELGGLSAGAVSGVGVADGFDAGGGDGGGVEGGGITIVGVDTSEGSTASSLNVGEEGSALVHGAAVSAAPVEFAESLDAVRVDLDGSAAVVLDNFVFSVLGASTDDVGLARGLLDGDGILTDIFEPDVVDIARAEAVDTFGLVGADHDVLDGSTALDEEDGIGVTTLGLLSAGTAATVVPDVSTVKDSAGSDSDGLGKRRGLGGRREGARGGTSDNASFFPFSWLEGRSRASENSSAESSGENGECE